MRIVFVSYHFSPDIHSPQEWIERIQFYVGTLECLAKQHSVIRVDQINYEGSFDYHGVHYHFVDDGKNQNYFPVKLNRFVKSLEPDIVVVASFLFPLQVIQLRRCLGPKVKLVAQHHAEKPFTGIKKILQKMASRKLDAFIFTSSVTGKDWVQKGNLHSIKKLHELVEGSSIFRQVDKHIAKIRTGVTGDPVFLWVGRLNDNKDPLLVVKTFLEFVVVQPAARLYMIYQTTELLHAIKELFPANSPVILAGNIKHPDLLYWYNSADYYISASHYEGSGTALCEAMSCGCIPIVTDIPSFRSITANGKAALLYNVADASDLLNKLQLTTTLDTAAMRSTVLTQFQEELSFQAIADNFQKKFDSL